MSPPSAPEASLDSSEPSCSPPPLAPPNIAAPFRSTLVVSSPTLFGSATAAAQAGAAQPPSAEKLGFASEDASLYDANFAKGFAANLLFMVGQTLSFNYSRYVVSLGGTDETVGWITGVGFAAVLLCRPWMGGWVDSFGTRQLWIAGLILYAVAVLGNLAADSVGPLLVLLRVGWNLGWGIVFVCNTAYPAQIAPPHRRAEAIGAQGIGGFVGTLLGPQLGDLIFGLSAEWHYPCVFGTAAGCAGLAAVLVSQLRPPPPTTGGSSRDGADSLLTPLRELIRHWPGPVSLIGLSMGMLFALTMSFVARHADAHAINGYGLFFLNYAVGAAGVRIAFRRLPEQLGRPGIIVLGLAFAVAGYQSFQLVADRLGYLIPGLLLGLSHGLVFPSMVDLASDRFPPDRRGLATSVIIGTQELGMLLAAPVMGWAVHRFGFGPLFNGMAVVVVLVAGVFAWMTLPRAVEHRSALPAQA